MLQYYFQVSEPLFVPYHVIGDGEITTCLVKDEQNKTVGYLYVGFTFSKTNIQL